MIDNRIISSDRSDPAFGQSPVVYQRPDNGAEYYGITTVAAIVGTVLGAMNGYPVLGLFTGIGAGVAGSICLIAGRHIASMLRDE